MRRLKGRSRDNNQTASGRRPPICRRFRLGSSFTEWEHVMEQSIRTATQHVPWNKGKLIGQKAPLTLKDIWAIRVRMQI